ncbi:unnamed protein product [Chilo suppressalis]|uniref:HAT C-terminal dimerisation domain-containing protein n=1 Tax=Chilo suppressalis TaxID=168631 RepID=A0ABN8AZE4_CHISP|nr:unnamed protein product [Chilo suppressalis]
MYFGFALYYPPPRVVIYPIAFGNLRIFSFRIGTVLLYIPTHTIPLALPLSAVLPARSTSVVKAELEVWKAVVTITSPTPKSALECLDTCNQKLYPNIDTLLQILPTIPVSTASPERTFSSLRRLKNYLRNTTSKNRLNCLALMNIYYGIEIDVNEIVYRIYLK